MQHDHLKRVIEDALDTKRLIADAHRDAAAAYQLGMRCHHGWHVSVDHQQAREHLLRAAAAGHALACYEMSRMHLEGDHLLGIPQDWDIAQRYADLGDTENEWNTPEHRQQLRIMTKVITAHRRAARRDETTRDNDAVWSVWDHVRRQHPEWQADADVNVNDRSRLWLARRCGEDGDDDPLRRWSLAASASCDLVMIWFVVEGVATWPAGCGDRGAAVRRVLVGLHDDGDYSGDWWGHWYIRQRGDVAFLDLRLTVPSANSTTPVPGVVVDHALATLRRELRRMLPRISE